MEKVTLEVFERYDDPVGSWYKCSECNNEIFQTDFNSTVHKKSDFNFCPYCGKEINKNDNDE